MIGNSGGVVICNSWYKETELERFKVKRKDVQRAYFLAVSSIFEPERALERLAWARTSILADAICSFFADIPCSPKLHDEFILKFLGKGSSNISSPECFIGYLLLFYLLFQTNFVADFYSALDFITLKYGVQLHNFSYKHYQFLFYK